MNKPKIIVNREVQAVDSASYVGTSWFTPGRLNQGPFWYDLQVELTASAALYLELASTSAGSAWGTMYFNKASLLLADSLYGFSFMVKGSNYFNVRVGATTTFGQLMIVERTEW